MKKAQLSFFIAASILILIIIAIAAYIRFIGFEEGEFTGLKKQQKISFDEQELKTRIQRCIEDNSQAGIYLIGIQGGYYRVPEKAISFADLPVAYTLYLEENLLPSLGQIQRELDNFMMEQIPICVNLDQYDRIKVEHEEVIAKTAIHDESVDFEVNYNLKLNHDGNNVVINEPRTVNVPIKFGNLYKQLNNIVNSLIEKPEEVDTEILLDTDYEVTVLPLPKTTVLIIIDDTSKIEDVNYVYILINRWEE